MPKTTPLQPPYADTTSPVGPSLNRGAHYIQFRVEGGPLHDRLLRYYAPEIRIGSSPLCNLRISDPSVPELHSVIQRTDENTTIDAISHDARLDERPFVHAILLPGSLLQVGDFTLEVLHLGGVAAEDEGRTDLWESMLEEVDFQRRQWECERGQLRSEIAELRREESLHAQRLKRALEREAELLAELDRLHLELEDGDGSELAKFWAAEARRWGDQIGGLRDEMMQFRETMSCEAADWRRRNAQLEQELLSREHELGKLRQLQVDHEALQQELREQHAQWREDRHQWRTTGHKNAETQRQLDSLREENQNLRNELQAARADHDSRQSDERRLEEDNQRLAAERDSLRRELSQLHGRREAESAQADAERESWRTACEEHQQTVQQLALLREEHDQLRDQVGQQDEQGRQQQQALEELEEQHLAALERIEDLQQELREAASQARQANEQAEQHRQAAEEAEATLEAMLAEFDQHDSQLQQWREKCEAAQEEAAALQAQWDAAQAQWQDALDHRQGELDALRNQLEEQQQASQAVAAEHQTLRQEHEALLHTHHQTTDELDDWRERFANAAQTHQDAEQLRCELDLLTREHDGLHQLCNELREQLDGYDELRAHLAEGSSEQTSWAEELERQAQTHREEQEQWRAEQQLLDQRCQELEEQLARAGSDGRSEAEFERERERWTFERRQLEQHVENLLEHVEQLKSARQAPTEPPIAAAAMLLDQLPAAATETQDQAAAPAEQEAGLVAADNEAATCEPSLEDEPNPPQLEQPAALTDLAELEEHAEHAEHAEHEEVAEVAELEELAEVAEVEEVAEVAEVEEVAEVAEVAEGGAEHEPGGEHEPCAAEERLPLANEQQLREDELEDSEVASSGESDLAARQTITLWGFQLDFPAAAQQDDDLEVESEAAVTADAEVHPETVSQESAEQAAEANHDSQDASEAESKAELPVDRWDDLGSDAAAEVAGAELDAVQEGAPEEEVFPEPQPVAADDAEQTDLDAGGSEDYDQSPWQDQADDRPTDAEFPAGDEAGVIANRVDDPDDPEAYEHEEFERACAGEADDPEGPSQEEAGESLLAGDDDPADTDRLSEKELPLPAELAGAAPASPWGDDDTATLSAEDLARAREEAEELEREQEASGGPQSVSDILRSMGADLDPDLQETALQSQWRDSQPLPDAEMQSWTFDAAQEHAADASTPAAEPRELDEDQQIRAYMRELLERSGVSPAFTLDSHTVPMPADDDDEPPRNKTAPVKDAAAASESSEYRPRRTAPEQSDKLQAMRELAVESAQEAINNRSPEPAENNVALQITSGLIALAISAAAGFTAFAGNTVGLVVSLAAFLVAVVWLHQGLQGLRRSSLETIAPQPAPESEQDPA